ncbi:MAG: hypothetical protein M3Q80_01260, partial [bacterium]|nr:hypothetical protein [bacterium]
MEKTAHKVHTILLFYKYVHLDDPKALADAHRVLCERLELKGRAIFAHEGINATNQRSTEAIETYC